ncbi:hypothetical protein GIX45_09185 [Erwinia sp. CPCC 100877]|nr:hypothetical protein [Erwinia sp. CPCC 100877]
MKITLKRQTTWGCVRHFSVYKNGQYQGKLFNNLPKELVVETGDVLEFKEGLFRFSQKIRVNGKTEEIIITNTHQLQQLFTLFILLFLAISLIGLTIKSLTGFVVIELSTFALLNQLFRYRSYQFNVEPQTPLRSFIKNTIKI